MAVLHLYKGRMNGTKATYNTCAYDFDNAVEGQDYIRFTSSEIQHGAPCPYVAQYPLDTTKNVKYFAATITLAGMNYFNGLKSPDEAPLRVDPWGSPHGGSNLAVIQVGSTQPADWTVHWRDKYYTRTAHYVDLTTVYYTYNPVPNDTFDPNETYFYIDETISRPMQFAWWTNTGNYFGAANGWRTYSEGYVRQFTVGAGRLNGDTNIWWKAGGVNGTTLFYDPFVGTALSAYIMGGGMPYDTTQEFAELVLDFVSFEYGEGEDREPYIGFVTISYGPDGVPTGASLCGMSDIFWRDEHGSSYTGPIS